MWSQANAYSTQPVVSPGSGMQRSSHSPLQWFLCYDSKAAGDGEKAKSSIKHLIGELFVTAITHTSHLSQNPVSQESGVVFSWLHIKAWKFCTNVRTDECHAKKFLNLNARSRRNSLWKGKRIWTEPDLHKSQCQALNSFCAGKTCFFQELSEWAECISTTFSGGAGNWASVAVGKAGERLHSVAEILSARDSWRSLVHAAARSRTPANTRWGQLRLSLVMRGHPPGAGVLWAL